MLFEVEIQLAPKKKTTCAGVVVINFISKYSLILVNNNNNSKDFICIHNFPIVCNNEIKKKL